jgi:two-component system, LytTR family, response regulator
MTDAPAPALRVAIVDDEPLARAVMREYLAAAAGIDIVAECANGFEAVKVVSELHPDLLFLDVQMPKLDGFEVLELVGRDVAVVFVTAYDQYAIRAFEVHAVDYLLKPFSPERLGEALARARDRLQRGERAPAGEVAELTAASRPGSARAGRVLVRDGPRVHVLPIEKVEYVQAQDDYVSYRCEGKDYLKEQTLAQAEAALDPAKFVRIHRSYLLNLECLARLETGERENRVAILTDGRRLPVSRAGYARLGKRL